MRLKVNSNIVENKRRGIIDKTKEMILPYLITYISIEIITTWMSNDWMLSTFITTIMCFIYFSLDTFFKSIKY